MSNLVTDEELQKLTERWMSATVPHPSCWQCDELNQPEGIEAGYCDYCYKDFCREHVGVPHNEDEYGCTCTGRFKEWKPSEDALTHLALCRELAEARERIRELESR